MEALDLKIFGQRIRERRHALDLSQQALADLMHAPQGWLSELENARQTHVQADTVFRLCRALEISADYLLGLTNDPLPFVHGMPGPLNNHGLLVTRPTWPTMTDAENEALLEESLREYGEIWQELADR